MWPIAYAFMRSNARFIVFPAALAIGALGYVVEGMISSKYTPYQPSIEQQRVERLTSAEYLSRATEKNKQKYENVLDKNLSVSLSRQRE